MKEPRDLDFSYVNEVMKEKEKDIVINQSMEPSELINVELRLREGRNYDDDVFILKGNEIKIPQLSFIDIRKANRKGLSIYDKTKIGKKILYLKRNGATQKEITELRETFTFEDELSLQEMTDIEDLWLVFFALRDIGYPNITGDFEKDKNIIEFLPRKEIEEYITKLRRFNGLSGNPSGEDDVKGFRS
ncbi:MAG: hypothetical protein ACFFG0_56205 [Candidatus Thorarchaeota archaeon]